FDSSTEKSIGNVTATMTLKDVTSPGALEIVLGVHDLFFAQLDRRTILVTRDQRKRDVDVTIQSLVLSAEIQEAEQRASGKAALKEDSKVDVEYRGESLHSAIMMLGQAARLTIQFDPTIEESAKQTSVQIKLSGATVPGALTFILDLYDLKYEQINDNAIRIVEPRQQYSSVPLGHIIKNRC